MWQSAAVRAVYEAWLRIVKRCTDPTDKNWMYYGGRGVTVHPEWLISYQPLLQYVGPKPERNRLLWLGLIDLAGNYEPGNVAWLSHRRQITHRRCCHRIGLNGETLTIEEMGRAIGMNSKTLRNRLLIQKVELERAATPDWLPYRNNSHHLTYQGQTLSLPEWAKLVGVPADKLARRLRLGVSPERALMPCDLRNPASRQAKALPNPGQP